MIITQVIGFLRCINRELREPSRGLGHYMTRIPFGYFLPLVEATSKAFELI